MLLKIHLRSQCFLYKILINKYNFKQKDDKQKQIRDLLRNYIIIFYVFFYSDAMFLITSYTLMLY